jgi:hypothetical protein
VVPPPSALSIFFCFSHLPPQSGRP